MKVYHRTISISSILIALFVLSSCSQSEQDIFDYKINWHYSDLRIVDPVDSKIPDMDVIALYMRDEDELLKLRLDLLEMDTESNGDIYIGMIRARR
jgi:hypothetical protein